MTSLGNEDMTALNIERVLLDLVVDQMWKNFAICEKRRQK